MIEQEGMVGFMVSSGFGHRTQSPYVQILVEAADWSTQMPPEKARELAFNLLRAAEAAESDGFFISFLRHQIGVADMNAVAGLLVQFREYREERQKRGDDE